MVYSIQVQTYVLFVLYPEEHVHDKMAGLAKRNVFERALYKVRGDLGEEAFQYFWMYLGSTPTNLAAIAQIKYHNRDDTKPVYICANFGCNIETTQRCNR